MAEPLQIVQLLGENRALVGPEGAAVEVDVSLIDNPELGDFLIVHAGLAIEKLDKDEAEETFALFDQIKNLDSSS